jgi:twitching motility protein PilT
LHSALRENPDAVLVGEMRDVESIQFALTIAETGHLVFATLHTNDTAQAIGRIIDVFPGEQQSQVRVQLAAA